MSGRPLKFKTPEELEKKMEEYFNTTKEEEWTITGLALALDTSRETLMDYEKRDGYSDTVKKGKLRVQNAYEKDLRRKGRSGDIFALKNFGWTDRRELTGEGGGPLNVIFDSSFSERDTHDPSSGTKEDSRG